MARENSFNTEPLRAFIKGKNMKFDSDAIDEACKELKGHDNWGYAEQFSEEILQEEIRKGNVIIFFDEAMCWNCDNLESECICQGE